MANQNKGLSYAEIKAKEDELRKALQDLDKQKGELMGAEATSAFTNIISLVNDFSAYFTPEQKAELAGALGLTASKKATKKATKNVTPKGDYVLANKDRTPFKWAGPGTRGKKPGVLSDFEASEEGKKLVEANKPTYQAVTPK